MYTLVLQKVITASEGLAASTLERLLMRVQRDHVPL